MTKTATRSTAESDGALGRYPARKHRAILRAGAGVFLRLGYESASMELIAAEAGVSKQTIYNHFGSKQVLFRAIVEGLVARLLEPIEDGYNDTEPELVLGRLARKFLALTLKPSSLAMHRLLVAEANPLP